MKTLIITGLLISTLLLVRASYIDQQIINDYDMFLDDLQNSSFELYEDGSYRTNVSQGCLLPQWGC